jgi:hypothetical protein
MTTQAWREPMSSKLDADDGVVTITGAGYTWAEPGHRLYVIGSAAEFAIDRPDWVIRLLDPPPAGNGRAWSEGVESTAEAEAALYARLGLVEPSGNERVAGEDDAPVAPDEAEALEEAT